MTRIIIVHGWGSNPKDNWFPWLKQKLEKEGHEVLVPAMPNPEVPKSEEWLSEMDKIIQNSNPEELILVGHSLGGLAILNYLESGKKAKTSILVASPTKYPDISGLTGFKRDDLDWEKVKLNCQQVIGIYSKDDDKVPYSHSKVLQKRLDSEIITLENKGHIMIKECPEILEAVLKNI